MICDICSVWKREDFPPDAQEGLVWFCTLLFAVHFPPPVFLGENGFLLMSHALHSAVLSFWSGLLPIPQHILYIAETTFIQPLYMQHFSLTSPVSTQGSTYVLPSASLWAICGYVSAAEIGPCCICVCYECAEGTGPHVFCGSSAVELELVAAESSLFCRIALQNRSFQLRTKFLALLVAQKNTRTVKCFQCSEVCPSQPTACNNSSEKCKLHHSS